MTALIIYHKSDFDGIFSCIILQKYLEDLNFSVEVFAWNYGEALPPLGRLFSRNYEMIVMVDVCFPVELMLKLKKTKRFTWIDHHETAIVDSVNNGFDDIPGYRSFESNKAACELSWEFCYPRVEVPKLIQYLSAFDIWNKKRFGLDAWENILVPLQYGLRSKYGMSEVEIYTDIKNIFEENYCNSIIEIGKLIYTYQKKSWESAVKNYAFEITVAGKYKGICMLSTTFESTQFDSIAENYDFTCVVNHRTSNKYSLSLYKDPSKLPEFHNGEYLKSLNYGNGGGHRGAAGVQLTEEQFIDFLRNKCI